MVSVYSYEVLYNAYYYTIDTIKIQVEFGSFLGCFLPIRV